MSRRPGAGPIPETRPDPRSRDPTLRVADATLYYEIRGSGPLVVLVGAPMDAAAFAPAADLLAVGNTVLTTDPRGIHRGRRSGRTPPRRTVPRTSPRC